MSDLPTITEKDIAQITQRLLESCGITREEADRVWAERCCASHAFEDRTDRRTAQEMSVVWGLLDAAARDREEPHE